MRVFELIKELEKWPSNYEVLAEVTSEGQYGFSVYTENHHSLKSTPEFPVILYCGHPE